MRRGTSSRFSSSFGSLNMTSSARELPIVAKLPAWLLSRIGSIVSQHAILEWRLSRIIYTLLDVDPKAGRITVREPRTTDRFDMICDLIKLKKLKIDADLATLRR